MCANPSSIAGYVSAIYAFAEINCRHKQLHALAAADIKNFLSSKGKADTTGLWNKMDRYRIVGLK